MIPGDGYVDATLTDIKNTLKQKWISVRGLVHRIESGNIESVKKDLLLFRFRRASLKNLFNKEESFKTSNPLTNRLPKFVVKIIGRRCLYLIYWFLTKLTLQDVRLRKRENKSYTKLLNETSAKGFIYQYFKKLMNSLVFSYYTYKFGQPRYLVGLSLLTTLPVDDKPILDLACGGGHTMHYLTHRFNKQPVIGMDRSFTKLYLAKKFVAPTGNYFCAEADHTLPFEEGTFSGVFCSDAFGYFAYRKAAVFEMKRVLDQNGVIIITRILGEELKYYRNFRIVSFDQLKRYFKDRMNIILEQDHVLERYIQKKGPDLLNELPLKEMKHTGWLSIVASHRKDIFKVYGVFEEWPHAFGYLKLNPLYHETGRDENGNVTFTFRFPDNWYAYEDSQWKKYAPETVKISKDTLEAISKNIRTPEIDDLISKCVVVGMPKKYLPSDHLLQ
ncbi:MAG: methyltransferase domain-containing protein [Chlorobi bacterium]|nr:methyltransferase domain-containing protein [Chlorobiota bacterium]